MINKLAVLIVGEPNSGKTTTLKFFHNSYNANEVDSLRQGWRYNFMPFKPNYCSIKIWPYFIPASRSEKRISLEHTIEKLDWYPDFIFMAEQLDGAEYQNTISYLRENEYIIKEFILSKSNPDSIWHYFPPKEEKIILTQRTEQIAEYVREFIRRRI